MIVGVNLILSQSFIPLLMSFQFYGEAGLALRTFHTSSSILTSSYDPSPKKNTELICRKI